MQKAIDLIGEVITTTITGLDESFRGTCEFEGLTLYVEGGTPGDRLDVRIDSVSRHHPMAYGTIEEAHEWGESVLSPPCPRAAPIRGRCGGCPGMHLKPEVQDRVRREHVEATLEGLSEDIRWHETENRLGYRNRSNYAVTRRRDGDVILGSFAPRSRKIVSMKGCLVARPIIAEVQEILRRMIFSREIPTNDSEGALRWLSLRASDTDQVVIELVTTDEEPLWLEHFAHALMKIRPVKGVAVSFHDDDTNAIRDSIPRTIAGDATIRETFGAIRVDVPPGAFAQLNTEVASEMYLNAAELVDGPGVVWDLYGGLGGLGLNVALRHPGTKVYGADSVAESIEEANNAAARHELDADYRVVNLKKDFPADWPTPDTVIVNPPRRGLDKNVIKNLSSSPAKSIIYMSCDVSSFAKDVKKLAAAGWRLGPVEVYDMLPQTAHVEILAQILKERPLRRPA
ncbi:MAG: 23S rRNA (uracil(1939)-C(5))-methyltransferase RlmD [Bradymonadaceae bacterium]